jgi:hypothetical protein
MKIECHFTRVKKDDIFLADFTRYRRSSVRRPTVYYGLDVSDPFCRVYRGPAPEEIWRNIISL